MARSAWSHPCTAYCCCYPVCTLQDKQLRQDEDLQGPIGARGKTTQTLQGGAGLMSRLDVYGKQLEVFRHFYLIL